MPKLSVAVNPSPQGYNSSDHPALVPANRGQKIQGFLCDQTGLLRASMQTQTIHTFPVAPDGVAYWYGESSDLDQMLVISGGSLWVAKCLAVNDGFATWGTFANVGSGFLTGQQVRWSFYDVETIFVQEGGIQPLRYDGNGLYQLGISGPVAAPLAVPGIPSGGAASVKLGTIQYCYSYFDSKFRESEVGPTSSINYTTFAGKDGYIKIDFGTDPQIAGVYLYATTQGSNTQYRIATMLKANHTVIWEDNKLDSIVNTGTQAPHPGQFTIPNPASCIAIEKRQIFLNDTTSAKVMQVNNIDSPTQWADVTVSPADGTRIAISASAGSQIVAMQPFGSLMAIWTRSGFMHLYGDNPTNFTLKQVHSKGCLSASSAVWCDNLVAALMQDGRFWNIADVYVFRIDPMDNDIQKDIVAHTEAEKQAACACFFDNRYMVSIGDTLYLYDFKADNSWTTAQWIDPVSGNASQFNSIMAINQKGGKPMVYMTNSTTKELLALDVNSSSNTITNGIYNSHMFVSPEDQQRQDVKKRVKRFKQEGSCASGTTATATLTLVLDRSRRLTYSVQGPYRQYENIMFYLEFPPAMTDAREISVELSSLTGLNLVLEKQDLQTVSMD